MLEAWKRMARCLRATERSCSGWHLTHALCKKQYTPIRGAGVISRVLYAPTNARPCWLRYFCADRSRVREQSVLRPTALSCCNPQSGSIASSRAFCASSYRPLLLQLFARIDREFESNLSLRPNALSCCDDDNGSGLGARMPVLFLASCLSCGVAPATSRGC